MDPRRWLPCSFLIVTVICLELMHHGTTESVDDVMPDLPTIPRSVTSPPRPGQHWVDQMLSFISKYERNGKRIMADWIKNSKRIKDEYMPGRNMKLVTIQGDLPLQVVLRMLQGYPRKYKDQKDKDTLFQVNIGSKKRFFALQSTGGRKIAGYKQSPRVLVKTFSEDWPETESHSRNKSSNDPDFRLVVKSLDIQDGCDSNATAQMILRAIEKNLNSQPAFSSCGMSAQKERAAVEFILLTQVAVAAWPTSEQTLNDWKKAINSTKQGRWQQGVIDEISSSAGNIGFDQVIRDRLLTEVIKAGHPFEIFNPESPNTSSNATHLKPFKQVMRRETSADGKTSKGRLYLNVEQLHDPGSMVMLPGKTRTEQEASHEVQRVNVRLEALQEGQKEYVQKAILDALHGSVHSDNAIARSRRRKRSPHPPLPEDLMLKPGSLRIDNTTVQFKVIDRKDPTVEHPLVLKIDKGKLVRENFISHLVTSSRSRKYRDRYTDSKQYVQEFMGTYGLVQGLADAQHMYQDGDEMRGAFFLSQTLQADLARFDGLTKIVSEVSKNFLNTYIKSYADELGLGSVLAKITGKTEKSAGAGKSLGNVNLKGLQFDLGKIGTDIMAIIDKDFHDKNDLIMLPLKVIHLVLDVCSTVLKLVVTAHPELAPFIKVLSIVRMTIDAFYIEIVDELQQVNWKSPWAPLEAIGAIALGILKGAIDILTGGLIMKLKQLSREHKANQKLLDTLGQADNYFKIQDSGKDCHAIDFTGGKASIFGGNMTVRLLGNGRVDVTVTGVPAPGGGTRSVHKIMQIAANTNDIILGLGQSREFTYTKKTAKLLWIIPIKSRQIICGEHFDDKSLHGTYYGNSKANKFYAVQDSPKFKDKSSLQAGDDCASKYGKLDISNAINHYHYNLYGKGGDDLFFLGPQSSNIDPGEGSDLILLQDDGGVVTVNNYAHDGKRDLIFLNTSFSTIHCFRRDQDLHVKHSKTHYILVKNWYVGGNQWRYRHLVFRSRDGYIFSPYDLGLDDYEDELEMECRVSIVEKTDAKTGQTIDLTKDPLKHVIQVVGSPKQDRIIGNEKDNFLDGAGSDDYLKGNGGSDTYIVHIWNKTSRRISTTIIDNHATDNKTDSIVFDIPFRLMNPAKQGKDLIICHNFAISGSKACVNIKKWFQGPSYQHASLISSDHAVFTAVEGQGNNVTIVPIILDFETNANKQGVKVNLAVPKAEQEVRLPDWAYAHVVTVIDSPYEDMIFGNAMENFLSCTGSGSGTDTLMGNAGEDKYMIKENCSDVRILNFDEQRDWDVLYIKDDFANLNVWPRENHLEIKGKNNMIFVDSWFAGPDYSHLLVHTQDGFIATIPQTMCDLEHNGFIPTPIELTKDPSNCTAKGSGSESMVPYMLDLNKKPFAHVSRLVLRSRLCNYSIIGNNEDNYIDAGFGNHQYFEGRNGSDIYVFRYGYGSAIINNFAIDNKTDYLKLEFPYNDVMLSILDNNTVYVSSKAKPHSVKIILKNYFYNASYQHLYIRSVDGVTFSITKDSPLHKVLSMDMSHADSSRNVTATAHKHMQETKDIYGSLNHSNVIRGNAMQNRIGGGRAKDKLHGDGGHDYIEGFGGNDRLIGGLGMDILIGGEGHDILDGGPESDVIFPGEGSDLTVGGHGFDTLVFKGNVLERRGVQVHLSHSFGHGAEANDDVFVGIENVWASDFNDILVGNNHNNELQGFSGDDILSPGDGNDVLCGGPGSDTYFLINHSGLKVIDNHDVNKKGDFFLLNTTRLSDIKFMRWLDHLYLVIHKDKGNIQGQTHPALDMLILNWFNDSTFRHGYFVTADDRIVTEKHFENAFDVSSFIVAMEAFTDVNVTSCGSSYMTLTWNQTLSDLAKTSDCELYICVHDSQYPDEIDMFPVGHETTGHVTGLNPDTEYSYNLALVKYNRVLASSSSMKQRTNPALSSLQTTLIIVGLLLALVLILSGMTYVMFKKKDYFPPELMMEPVTSLKPSPAKDTSQLITPETCQRLDALTGQWD